MLYQMADWVWKRLYIEFCCHKYRTVWFGKTGGVTLNSDYRYAPEYGRIERCWRCGKVRNSRGAYRDSVFPSDEPNLASRLIATRTGEIGGVPPQH